MALTWPMRSPVDVDADGAVGEQLVDLVAEVAAAAARGGERLGHLGAVDGRVAALLRAVAGLDGDLGDGAELRRHLGLALGEATAVEEQLGHRVGEERRQPAVARDAGEERGVGGHARGSSGSVGSKRACTLKSWENSGSASWSSW